MKVLIALGLFCCYLLIGCTYAVAPVSYDLPAGADEVCEDSIFGDPMDYSHIGARGLVAVVRILDSCELDRQLVLTHQSKEKPSLKARTTIGGSVDHQLRQLRKKRPELDFQDACELVEYAPYDFNAPEDRILQEKVEALRKLRISPTIDAPLVLDGTHYRIWLFSEPVNFSHFDFFGAGASTATQKPLQEWVDQLLSIVGFECR